jgi:hypothetical protein
MHPTDRVDIEARINKKGLMEEEVPNKADYYFIHKSPEDSNNSKNN